MEIGIELGRLSGLIYSVDSCVCFWGDFFFFLTSLAPQTLPLVAIERCGHLRTPLGRVAGEPGAGGHGGGGIRPADCRAREAHAAARLASCSGRRNPGRRGSAAVPFASARGSQRARRSGWVWGRREAEGRARGASVPAGWWSGRGRGRRARLGRGM